MSALALQNALYTALSADATLGALITGIYDNPTQVVDPSDNSAFPFVTISDVIIRPWDTDTETGSEAAPEIHIWSRAHHALEVKEIADAITNVLHRGTITIVGHTFIGCDYNGLTVLRDPDGITRHGVIDFRMIFERN